MRSQKKEKKNEGRCPDRRPGNKIEEVAVLPSDHASFNRRISPRHRLSTTGSSHSEIKSLIAHLSNTVSIFFFSSS